MGAIRIISEDVRQFIVSLYRQGGHTQGMIAQLAGTTQSNVSKILSQARREGLQLPRRNSTVGNDKRPPTSAVSQLGPAGFPLNMDYL
jgi:transposase-like protein